LQETASKAEAEPGLIPRMILTDLNMPVLNGFGLLKWVRQNPPFIELPVIILSGCGSKRDMEDAYALGADLCLEKPSDLRENVEMLRALNFWLKTLTFSGRPLAGRSRM
ncbi:MAG: response regulator, partial [Limisphaerales bacterium]